MKEVSRLFCQAAALPEAASQTEKAGHEPGLWQYGTERPGYQLVRTAPLNVFSTNAFTSGE